VLGQIPRTISRVVDAGFIVTETMWFKFCQYLTHHVKYFFILYFSSSSSWTLLIEAAKGTSIDQHFEAQQQGEWKPHVYFCFKVICFLPIHNEQLKSDYMLKVKSCYAPLKIKLRLHWLSALDSSTIYNMQGKVHIKISHNSTTHLHIVPSPRQVVWYSLSVRPWQKRLINFTV
jgi:hypothetical protein